MIKRNVIGVVHPREYDWQGQINHMIDLNRQGHSMQMVDAGKVIGLGMALESAQDTIRVLMDALEEFRDKHHRECEDGWYSCPKSESYIKHVDSDDEWGCDCGADRISQKVDAALVRVQNLHGVEDGR